MSSRATFAAAATNSGSQISLNEQQLFKIMMLMVMQAISTHVHKQQQIANPYKNICIMCQTEGRRETELARDEGQAEYILVYT